MRNLRSMTTADDAQGASNPKLDTFTTQHPTIEDFVRELLPALDEADRQARKDFDEYMAERGGIDHRVRNADPTWTGFIDRLRVDIVADAGKDRVRNYIGFRPESKRDTVIEVDFSTTDYRDLLTVENRDAVLLPALTTWFQEKLDTEEYGGFYDTYLAVQTWIVGYECSGKYGEWSSLKGLKPDMNRRLHVRDYLKTCVTSRNYDEWKSAGDNPAHLEVLWLYDQVGVKDLRWYFERLYMVNGDDPVMSLFYNSWTWQVQEFVREVCAKDALTPEQCRGFYDTLEVMKSLEKFGEHQVGMDFLKQQGFDPTDADGQAEANDLTLTQDVMEVIEDKFPSYVREFANARQRAVDTERRKKKGKIDWLEEGYVVYSVRLRLDGDEIMFEAPSFDTEYGTSAEGTAITFAAKLSGSYDIAALTSVQKQELFDVAVAFINEQMDHDDKVAFAPVVEVQLEFGPKPYEESRWRPIEYTRTITREGSDAWFARIKGTYEKMLVGETTPYSNLSHHFTVIWMYMVDRDLPRMLTFLETYFDKLEDAPSGDSVRESMSWMMRTEATCVVDDRGIDKSRKQFGEMTRDEHALITFAAKALIDVDEGKHDVRFGHELEKIAEKTKIIEAEVVAEVQPASEPEPEVEVVKEERWYTELFDEDEEDATDDIVREYGDDNVLLAAGYYPDGREDYFTDGYGARGWVTCKVLCESEAAYKAAIDFMSGIIVDGFPARLDHFFISQVKNYVPIMEYSGKPIHERQESQFWANAATYPALHDVMRDYVKLSTSKVKYIRGDEMEEDDSAYYRPDFYAASMLALMDPTGKDFAESLGLYSQTIDMYYAREISRVIRCYLGRYAVTPGNATNLASTLEYGFGDIISDYLDYDTTPLEEMQLLVEYGKRAGVDMEMFEENLGLE